MPPSHPTDAHHKASRRCPGLADSRQTDARSVSAITLRQRPPVFVPLLPLRRSLCGQHPQRHASPAATCLLHAPCIRALPSSLSPHGRTAANPPGENTCFGNSNIVPTLRQKQPKSVALFSFSDGGLKSCTQSLTCCCSAVCARSLPCFVRRENKPPVLVPSV